MDEALIAEWNRVVPEDGIVYHLGDVSLGSPNKAAEFLNRLNGTIHLIEGNHEKSVLKKEETRKRFASIQDVLMIGVEDADAISGRKVGIQEIFMSHYSHRVWNKSHRGVWHCFGHSHGGLDKYPWGKSMDVGVDSHATLFGTYAPFTYQEIKDIMSTREIKVIDHHNNEEE
jgi:calcineurin-like phosphoesterase family protein